jgi:ubiquinone/menaquinone biosynthesis C-methylase UbiE
MPLIKRILHSLRGSMSRAFPSRRFTVGRSIPRGWVDDLQVESTGRIYLTGWSKKDEQPALDLVVAGIPVAPKQWFRTARPDVARIMAASDAFLGFGMEFAPPHLGRVTVRHGGADLFDVEPDAVVNPPHYAGLFDEVRVLHREHIYGVGPPVPVANPELVELACTLQAPVLDFGCGSGALVRAMRTAGVETLGIELSRPEIIASLHDDVKARVTLYDGAFPLPFPDRRFRSVVCSEVLEHIADYEAAVGEMARVADAALVTVPDMSAVPALFPHFVVPWHLLEGTHVNFFTQTSLGALLSRYYQRVSFARVGAFEVNGTKVYTSLVARCAR